MKIKFLFHLTFSYLATNKMPLLLKCHNIEVWINYVEEGVNGRPNSPKLVL